MNWSLILGVVGIVVSILVGWLFYVLTNRQVRKQRYLTVKATVLQQLSTAIGEDNIPSASIIASTIRSVIKESGHGRLQIDVRDVVDDLVRQIASDPFLSSDRRRKLLTEVEEIGRQEELPVESAKRTIFPTEAAATIAGLIGALLSLVALGFIASRSNLLGELRNWVQTAEALLYEIMLAFLFLVGVLAVLQKLIKFWK